jgi:hypothetical protein
MRKILIILIITASLYGGWFFIPWGYWTFQDGGVGVFYTQGNFEKLGWEFDGRMSGGGDYWLDGTFGLKMLGEGTRITAQFASDSIEKDYRKPDAIDDGDTIQRYPSYTAKEFSIYLKQNFNVGPSRKFYLYAGYKSGEYLSKFRFDASEGGQVDGDETTVASAVDAGFEFSMDSRDDPENPQTAFYLGIKLGGLYFPNAEEPNFDYLKTAQLQDPTKSFPNGTGYISLDQRLFGKLKIDEVPFPLILALRISLGHHLHEVPQLVAFKGGTHDFLRGIDQRHILGQSYYIMSGELRAQIWKESYTPLILLHWLIPGYENPRPILEIAPIVEAARIYSEFLGDDEKQYMTYGLGLRWIFTDYTVMRYDFAYCPSFKTWGAYFSFYPSI